MSISPVLQAGYFLVDTLFGLYILVYLLRFMLQLVRADFYNPLSQFIVRLTNPLLLPMRKIIPGFGGMDCAGLLLVFALTLIKLLCLSFLAAGHMPAILGLCIWTSADLLGQVIQLYFYAILLQAVLSWISPNQYNPMASVILQLTAPLMRPVRKWLPPVAGFDLSPIPVIIGLQLFNILLVSPLATLGRTTALL